MFSIQRNFTITKRHKTNNLIFVLFVPIFFFLFQFKVSLSSATAYNYLQFVFYFFSFFFHFSSLFCVYFFLYVNINKYGLHHKTIVNSHFTFDCEQEDRENPFRNNKTKEKREEKTHKFKSTMNWFTGVIYLANFSIHVWMWYIWLFMFCCR